MSSPRPGYVAPHWPRPWGLDASPIMQLVIDDEMRRAKVARPQNQIGIGWAGPTILYAGSDEQKERYLFPLLAGEEVWCQLFSEPGAGSDLASLTTKAVRDGDEFIVNGQKVWTSGAQFSKFGILIARTDPDAPKHRGISYFVCPMDTPGIEIRPDQGDDRHRSVQRGVLHRRASPGREPRGRPQRWVGPREGDARERARVAVGRRRALGQRTVGERPARSGAGRRRHRRSAACANVSPRLHIEAEVLRLIRLRTVTAAIRGRPPGPEASVRKVLSDEHGQHIMELAKDLAGTAGMLTGEGAANDVMWHHGYLFARALTIGGGTGEVQRNIIAERVLGLPHDPAAA